MRNEEKGRRKARKARGVVRSKPDTRLRPPVLPSVDSFAHEGLKENVRLFSTQALDATKALRDALHFYDRVAGNVRADRGWTAADVKRLAEIREIVTRDP
jgi:hypothetical protein